MTGALSGKAAKVLSVMKLDEEVTSAELSRRLGGELNSREIAGVLRYHLVGKHVHRAEALGDARWKYTRFI